LRVDEAVTASSARTPSRLCSAFNVHRNVSSPESGTDSSRAAHATEFDVSGARDGPGYARRSGIYRTWELNAALARGFAARPRTTTSSSWVNDGGWHLRLRDLTSPDQPLRGIVVHELGHAIFDLADSTTTTAPTPSPARNRPTTSTVTNRASLKWSDLVLTALPFCQRQ
jgi:hypothetical protein